MNDPQRPELPTDIIAAAQRAAMPDFPRWQQMINATGGCAQPIRLRGDRLTVDAATGELIESYTTDSEPAGYLLTACGNRRASRCPACAEVYRDDTYHLIISGLSGGKNVPQSVSAHPRVFATLTAPSFGAVHSHRQKAGKTLPCQSFPSVPLAGSRLARGPLAAPRDALTSGSPALPSAGTGYEAPPPRKSGTVQLYSCSSLSNCSFRLINEGR